MNFCINLTVLYQFLKTGTSDITFMGRNQELKGLAFSSYLLSFVLYSPFNDDLKLFKCNDWKGELGFIRYIKFINYKLIDLE